MAPPLEEFSLTAGGKEAAALALHRFGFWPGLPKLAFAEGRDRRFLTIILRGARDEIATVAPVGDPVSIKLRGDQALTLDGRTPALKLNDFLALNPATLNLNRFKANEAIVVHPWASPIASVRHDLFESGLARTAISDSGWLSRVLVGLSPLAPAGRVHPHGGKAFTVGPVTPIVMSSPAPVLSWLPQQVQPASADAVSACSISIGIRTKNSRLRWRTMPG
jgi:uncharacterized protein (DUF1501 family)